MDTSAFKELVIQWKESKVNRLRKLAEDHLNHAEEEIDMLKQKYEFEVRSKCGLTEQEEDMFFQTARKIAEALKGNERTEDRINEEFSKMWNSLIKTLGNKYSSNTDSVADRIQLFLQKSFSSELALLKCCAPPTNDQGYADMVCLEGSITLENIKMEYIGFQTYPSNKSKYEAKQHARSTALDKTNAIFKKLDTKINEIKDTKAKFDIVHFTDLIKEVVNSIQMHNNNQKENWFLLLNPYKAMLINHVQKYADILFTNMDEQYEKKNGMLRKLADYKEYLWVVFLARLAEQSEVVAATSIFNQVVKDAVYSSVSTFLPIDVKTVVLRDFSHTKFKLMVTIMDNLAEKEKFELFCSYIEDSESYAKKWMSEYIEDKIFRKKKMR